MANTAEDRARIVRFDYVAPTFSEGGVFASAFLALANTGQDLASLYDDAPLERNADLMTARDNNVTLRNVLALSSANSPNHTERLMVHNGNHGDSSMRLVATVPEGWKLEIEGAPLQRPFAMDRGESREVVVRLTVPDQTAKGDVRIFQQRLDPRSQRFHGLGGVTLRLR